MKISDDEETWVLYENDVVITSSPYAKEVLSVLEDELSRIGPGKCNTEQEVKNRKKSIWRKAQENLAELLERTIQADRWEEEYGHWKIKDWANYIKNNSVENGWHVITSRFQLTPEGYIIVDWDRKHAYMWMYKNKEDRKYNGFGMVGFYSAKQAQEDAMRWYNRDIVNRTQTYLGGYVPGHGYQPKGNAKHRP